MIECEYAGVDPPSPPGVWSTPLSSVISLLGGRLLVLSSEAEIAAHYTDHRPVAGQFSVSRPYQQSSPAALTIAGQTIPGLTSDTSVPQPPAGVHFTGVFDGPSIHGLPIADLDGSLHRPQSTDLSGSEGNGGAEITPRVRRKRKRGVARAPNIAEEQAMVRHSAFRAALNAAAAELQAWLVASCPVGQPPLLRAVFEAQTRQSASKQIGADSSSVGIEGGSGGEGGDAVRPGTQLVQQLDMDRAHTHVSDIEGSPEIEAGSGPTVTAVDFAVLHQLKHVTRPKLTWAGAPISASQPPNRGPTRDQPSKNKGIASSRAAAVPSFSRKEGPDEQPQILASEPNRAREGLAQPPSHGSCKLYDALIVNHGPRDAAAMAAEWPVVLPPDSAFLMSDVTRLRPLMPGESSQGFGLVVLDPPWENASATRGAKYASLPSRALLRLPLPELLHPGGALVAIWMTNRERHWRFVEAELLPAFQLTTVATWLWLKVTDSCELDSEHRRPYEGLLLAHSSATAQSAEWRKLQPPDQLVLAAVPGEHSRKPHLGRLLRRYVPPNTRCLEMFAREMAAGWTGWGNEVLKFQSADRFVTELG